MPSFTGDNHELPRAELFRLEQSKLRYLLLHALTFAITTVENCGESSSLSKIVTLEKFDDMSGNIHPTSSVDPRRDPKSDVIARHFRSAIRDFHQSFQTVVLRVRKILQSECDDRAILAGQLHD